MTATRKHTLRRLSTVSIALCILVGITGQRLSTPMGASAASIEANIGAPHISEFAIPTPFRDFRGTPIVGPDHSIWFSDGSLIKRVTTSGSISEFPLPYFNSNPYDFIVGPDQNIWFLEAQGSTIGRITPNGHISEFPISNRSDSVFSYESSLIVGPDGELWFTEAWGNKIGRITLGGHISEFPIPTPKCNPGDLILGSDRNLWFSESNGNKIGRITPSGHISDFLTPTAATTVANSDPGALILGPDHNLWFPERYEAIGRITPSGHISEFPTPTGVSGPDSLILGPDHNLWFIEYNANKIGRITPSGQISEFPTPTRGSYPSSLILGPDHNFWFTEYKGSKVGRITLTGDMSEFPITPNSGPGGPILGPDHNLWFIEYNASKVGRITPYGIAAAPTAPSRGAVQVTIAITISSCPPFVVHTFQELIQVEAACIHEVCPERDAQGELVFVGKNPPDKSYKPVAGTTKGSILITNSTGGALLVSVAGGPMQYSWRLPNNQAIGHPLPVGAYQLTVQAQCGRESENVPVTTGVSLHYTYRCTGESAAPPVPAATNTALPAPRPTATQTPEQNVVPVHYAHLRLTVPKNWHLDFSTDSNGRPATRNDSLLMLSNTGLALIAVICTQLDNTPSSAGLQAVPAWLLQQEFNAKVSNVTPIYFTHQIDGHIVFAAQSNVTISDQLAQVTAIVTNKSQELYSFMVINRLKKASPGELHAAFTAIFSSKLD